MKDDAASLVTGILMLSEVERRNNEEQREQQYRNDSLSAENSTLSEQNKKALAKNIALKEDHDDLLDDVQTLNIINRELVAKNQRIYDKGIKLRDELDEYKLLLCKPMSEIAARHGKFNETYEQQMELIATWIVSQKAFKELAIQFGIEKGLSAKEVIDLAAQKKLDVLDSKNEPSHNTNIAGSKIITPERAEKIKAKMNGK